MRKFDRVDAALYFLAMGFFVTAASTRDIVWVSIAIFLWMLVLTILLVGHVEG